MDKYVASLLAFVIICVIIIIGAFIWHTFFGWVDFDFKSGDNVKFEPGGKKTELLRFKNVIFKVIKADAEKTTFSKNITENLNLMAKLHDKSGYMLPIKLGTSLNAFSFTVEGSNDNVTNNKANEWKNATVTLIGKYRIL